MVCNVSIIRKNTQLIVQISILITGVIVSLKERQSPSDFSEL